MISGVSSLFLVLCGTVYPALEMASLKQKQTNNPFPNFLEWDLLSKNIYIIWTAESASLSNRMGTESPCTLPCVKGCCLCVCSQSSMLQLVESGRYDTREDFSVVLQPFLLNTKLPVLEVYSPTHNLELWRKNCYGHLCKRTTKAGMHVPPQHENKAGRPQGDLQMLC